MLMYTGKAFFLILNEAVQNTDILSLKQSALHQDHTPASGRQVFLQSLFCFTAKSP